MNNKSYKVLESKEEEFHLLPPTFGTYKKLKLFQLGCTAIPQQIKTAIMQEFHLGINKDEKADEFGLGDLYIHYIDNLFLEEVDKYNVDDVNIAELNRAVKDFFESVGGS